MLGDHIRKRRLDLGLFQRQVAERIGVDEDSIYRWESNATSPQVTHLPAIIEFARYNPCPAPQSTGERLIAVRKARGLTQKEMAKRLGVDPTTLGRWERGRGRPSKKLNDVLVQFEKKG
jgi:transcriptional regulator with XRE-family HTH domain